MGLRKLPPAMVPLMIREYLEDGISAAEVGRRYGVSGALVSHTFRSLGIPQRSRSEAMLMRSCVRPEVFDLPLSQDARFWAGMMATDGCVTDANVISLSQSGDNVDAVAKFAKFVGGNVNIMKCGKHTCAIMNKQLADALRSIGITERKSSTLSVPQLLVNDRDFMRGAVCGDGSVSFAKVDNRRRPGITLGSISSAFIKSAATAWKLAVPEFSGHIVTETALQINARHMKCGGPRATTDFYKIQSGSWKVGAPLVEWLFRDVPSHLTIDWKQAEADKILAEFDLRQAAERDAAWPPPWM